MTRNPTKSAVQRVLVIDDNQDAALLLCTLINTLGHDAYAATNGVSGIAMAKELEPNLVFLDIGMPGMNGYEVCVELRKTPELQHLRICALTAWSDAYTKTECEVAGFDSHLTKPARIALIQNMIAQGIDDSPCS